MLFETPPLTIIDSPADANHIGGARSPLSIEIIILHNTVGGFQSSLDYLRRTSSGAGRVSTHRLIDKNGDIHKIVPDEFVAWHAGFGNLGPVGPNNKRNMNDISLGIELVNLNNGSDPYPEEQLNACVAQCLEWMGMYPGIKGILGHSDVDSRKTDPLGFNWIEFRRRLDLARLALVGGSMFPEQVKRQLVTVQSTLDHMSGQIRGMLEGLG